MSLFHKNTLLGASGAGGAAEALYVDDVYSTFLYEGTGSSNTITNDIDLSGEGGMVWVKARDDTNAPIINDTERGAGETLRTDSNGAEFTNSGMVSSFNSDGFTLGTAANVNSSGTEYVGWTFRKAPGFFDVVTWTGTGGNRNISHDLGSVPGCIILKRTDTAESKEWTVFHRSLGVDGSLGYPNQFLKLNSTDAAFGDSGIMPSYPTSTQFSVSADFNASGGTATYVAYIFAHDDQSFGDDSDEAIIKCDSVALPSSGDFVDVNLGFEPQWVLLKMTDFSPTDWFIFDNMRGVATEGAAAGTGDAILKPNTTGAETSSNYLEFTATGFRLRRIVWGSNKNVAYVAIRRPHKPPTDGDDVYKPIYATGSTNTERTIGFAADLQLARWISGSTGLQANDRLRGMPTSSNANALFTNSNAAESGQSPYAYDVYNTSAKDGSNANLNTMIWYYMRRAPGFFDVVAYTGTGSSSSNTGQQNITHNLGVVPELIIVKTRDGANDWVVYNATSGAGKNMRLNRTNSDLADIYCWDNTTPTSSVFRVGSDLSAPTNSNAKNFIGYLFASLDGISKVGTYSGAGSSDVDVDCGFTSGARFVLIKRTDSSGGWYAFDTARGIASGNDPFFEMDSTAAQTTNTDKIDPLNSGFTVVGGAGPDLNSSTGTYIFLAIA